MMRLETVCAAQCNLPCLGPASGDTNLIGLVLKPIDKTGLARRIKACLEGLCPLRIGQRDRDLSHDRTLSGVTA